ncbi:short-chain collagen C4-like [Mercenaria mercenaria]|uniref:short-chain collagen C4-like n=1 Tax=Mercenaria mercenaria TaxID=6596 RepID=UPI00234E6EB4|nr:short-chain collagen C4-like [Mercenaria mercenaria]
MAVTMGYVFVLILLCNVLHANSEKRLVLEEMDIEQEIINLKQSMAQKDAQISALQKQIGSTYTRWGRTTCPGNGTVLVYSGFMAGTYHDDSQHKGSGANYLCLSDQPTWDHYSETVNNVIRITGVQYEFWMHTQHAHDLQEFFGSDVHDSEAPCAVCRAPRSTNVMIPGRTDCYPGWTKEYNGYLVGAYSGYDDAAEYVCLDRRPETVVHSGDSDDDNMLYFVEAYCGKSLECPPYVNNRELACVVCSM